MIDRTIRITLLLTVIGACVSITSHAADISFDRDVRPILSDRCFLCHGPDAESRQAELRLDIEEAAKKYAIVPEKPDESEVWLRITSEDPDYRMPPPDSKLSLSKDEIATIRKWIEQGATWSEHWSFRPIVRPKVPSVDDKSWPTNEIDHFILERLEKEAITPSNVADKETLIRRVTYDLTGLPPKLKEIDDFLADHRPEAYEALVDRLLSSPHFGERMAVPWLDVARYADTFGYQSDRFRTVWPWRDWVVDAFNQNLPYDDFITWQLAGDLLPNPTQEQRIATAFCRLHRQTNEAGSLPEEFQAEYVADRVKTLGTAFMGLTLECARCHDHKFDPISQKEYYQLSAFFNSIDEAGVYSQYTIATPTPTLSMPSQQQSQELSNIERSIAEQEDLLVKLNSRLGDAFAAWMSSFPRNIEAAANCIADFDFDSVIEGVIPNNSDADLPGLIVESPLLVPGVRGDALKIIGESGIKTKGGGAFTRDTPFSISLWIKVPGMMDRAVILHRSKAWTDAGGRGYQLTIEDGKLKASLIHFWPGNAICVQVIDPLPIDKWTSIAVTYDGSSRAKGLKMYVDGKLANTRAIRDKLTKTIDYTAADPPEDGKPIAEITNFLTVGHRFRDRSFEGGLIDNLKVFDRELAPLEVLRLCDPVKVTELQRATLDEITKENRELLFGYYLRNIDSEYRNTLTRLQTLREKRSLLVESIPEIMVMDELPEPRSTYLLQRGAYDAPGEEVDRGTPSCLPSIPDNLPRNRLGLAKWLTSAKHPMTSRVAVNYCWQTLFGRGLVYTADNFGTQGQVPSHPELLDWLASEFIDSGWDTKKLIKQIVMTTTYRQSSLASSEAYARDPENVLLARGSTFTLPAEMLRDGALAASGLLVDQLGGSPVKPYQPPGLWEEKSGTEYVRDEGDGSHRRSLYTFWKRTSPPPSMTTFDAVDREVCVAQRQPTVTPLQALVLLNDPQYIEAARVLAEVATDQGGPSLDNRITFAFRSLTGRIPSDDETEALSKLYATQLTEFGGDQRAAERYLAIGDAPHNDEIPAPELASMTAVVQAIMNFSDSVLRR